MAAAVEQNFSAVIGEDFVQTFTVYQADGTTLQSLVGATVLWRARKHPLSSEATPTLSIAGALVGTGSTGQFTVTVTDEQTDALEPRVYHHDAKVTDSGGLETVVALGTMDLKPY